MDIKNLKDELIKVKEELIKTEEECSKQFTKINMIERYTEEWDKERLIFQELTRKKEMLLSKLLTLGHKNIEKKELDKVVFTIDDDFTKYTKTGGKKMSKQITNTPKSESKKPVVNHLSQHRIEMFEKHKEDVRKMFKEKKKVSEINAFLKGKGALQDLANYILLRLKLKTMGNVPEKAQIKRDEALVMAVNEKNKTEQKAKK